MYLVREIVHCKPGKVRDMVNKFKGISGVRQRMGFTPYRLFTDVSGERFWTIVAETEVGSLNDFFQMEDKVMADKEAQQVMSGYHELVEQGRREFYRSES